MIKQYFYLLLFEFSNYSIEYYYNNFRNQVTKKHKQKHRVSNQLCNSIEADFLPKDLRLITSFL